LDLRIICLTVPAMIIQFYDTKRQRKLPRPAALDLGPAAPDRVAQ